MHFLLIYAAGPDYVEKRAPHRTRHLELARAAVERGELLVGGAAGDPPEGSILLFQGDSPAAAERFARNDPYVTEKVVTGWRVLKWTTVVGPLAAQPVA